MPKDYTKQTRVDVGQRVTMEIGFSECAMHMRVAGTVMQVELVPGHYHPMAQLFKDGQEYSAPITLGEAGFYTDDLGHYYYPEVG